MLTKFFQVAVVIAALYFIVDLIHPVLNGVSAQLLALIGFPVFGIAFTYIVTGSLSFSSKVGCEACKRTIKI
jgi:hypothetical protein